MLLLSLLSACNGSELTDDSESQTEAAQYVDRLMQDFRDGNISAISCPNVQWRHIPYLLEYGKSTEIIGDDSSEGPALRIPANPISSYLMFQSSEGMFALWMVEAARLHTLNSNNTGLNGWPSMNPFLQRLSADDSPLWYINNSEVQQEVLDAYVKWWKAADGNRAAAKTNPLEGTGYMWH